VGRREARPWLQTESRAISNIGAEGGMLRLEQIPSRRLARCAYMRCDASPVTPPGSSAPKRTSGLPMLGVTQLRQVGVPAASSSSAR
jgi:hypothetical protein